MLCSQGTLLLLDICKGDFLVTHYLSEVADDSRQITSIEIKVNAKSPISHPRVISSAGSTLDPRSGSYQQAVSFYLISGQGH
jgi:hypothetical protein